MDWRDFVRGFFGSTGPNSRRDQWPPPMPIPDFDEDRRPPGDRGQPDRGDDGDSARRGGFWNFRSFGEPVRPADPNDVEGNEDVFGFGEFGNNRFIFSDLFSVVGEMFREMERSTAEFDRFFGGHGGFGAFPMQPQLPAIPDSPESSQPRQKEDNVRDMVLKEPELGESTSRKSHYVDKPENSRDKIDHNLDELYQRSMLDLSDLPVPESENTQRQNTPIERSTISPFEHPSYGGGQSTFQRTFQTFKFINGRWEGEVVKEDGNGKHVTKYFEDKDGQRHETTEFFPRDGNGATNGGRPILEDSSSKDLTPFETPRGFQFFDRFFRPRM